MAAEGRALLGGRITRFFQDHGIAVSLTALVLAAVVPIIMFSVGIAWLFIEHQRSAAEAELSGVARAFTVAVERELDRQMAAMQVLATSDALDQGDLERFRIEAARVMAVHPSWLDVGLLDPVSKLLVSTQLPPPDKPQPSIAPAAAARVMTSGKPLVVGAFPAANVVKQPSVRMMAPVFRGGTIRYIMVAVVDPVVFNAIFAQPPLPPGWVVAVVDANMRLAGRSRDGEKYVGGPVAASVAERIAIAHSGLFESKTHEGERFLTVFNRSATTGWSVVVGIPADEFAERIRRTVTTVVTAGVVFAVLALLLAGVVGRVIVARRQAYERELRTQARELRENEELLRRSNAELEQFAYVSSHDLREPLRMVTSYLGLIERRFGDTLAAEGREFLDYAVDGAKRMDRLILDLLEYSRIGRQGVALERAALGEAVREALHNLAPAIEESRAEVNVQPDLPQVCANHSELVRLFQNLIGNAIKYRVPDRVPGIAVLCWREGRDWVVSVRDNGIGVPPEQAERIFGVFQRLHSNQEYSGTGIGLAICRKIVQLHGGRIWLEPSEGPGCDFRFTLPMDSAG
jgi:signal transduction histidine kinase